MPNHPVLGHRQFLAYCKTAVKFYTRRYLPKIKLKTINFNVNGLVDLVFVGEEDLAWVLHCLENNMPFQIGSVSFFEPMIRRAAPWIID